MVKIYIKKGKKFNLYYLDLKFLFVVGLFWFSGLWKSMASFTVLSVLSVTSRFRCQPINQRAVNFTLSVSFYRPLVVSFCEKSFSTSSPLRLRLSYLFWLIFTLYALRVYRPSPIFHFPDGSTSSKLKLKPQSKVKNPSPFLCFTAMLSIKFDTHLFGQ